jgi:hypothetical protein
MTPGRSALALLLLTVLGCRSNPADDKIPARARAALESGEPFELLSLDPLATMRESRSKQEEAKSGERFHGWKVLGRAQVRDGHARTRLLTALKQGVGENDGKSAMCFVPRHGIRVKHDGQVVDFVICFQCFQVQVFVEGAPADGFLVTGSPQRAFDQALRDAGVPLPGAGP